jgi:4-hydroxybenzoate polyprenyltransferase
MNQFVKRLLAYGQLIRIHQPVGIWLLGFPALWALWLASHGHPDETTFVIFMAGVFLTRSAGCAINDFADRHVDGHVKRTQDRPLARGAIKAYEAVLVFVILAAGALLLAFQLNTQTIHLAYVGGVLLVVYPFLKRIFSLPQAWLGLAFTWSIPMAYAALNQPIDVHVGYLFAAGVLWTLIYDTEYAMVDRDDDAHLNVRSTALLFGRFDRLIIATMQLIMLICLIEVGIFNQFSFWFYVGVGAAGACFVQQQRLIRLRDREGCFRAFRNNGWVGLCIFFGICLEFLFPH